MLCQWLCVLSCQCRQPGEPCECCRPPAALHPRRCRRHTLPGLLAHCRGAQAGHRLQRCPRHCCKAACTAPQTSTWGGNMWGSAAARGCRLSHRACKRPKEAATINAHLQGPACMAAAMLCTPGTWGRGRACLGLFVEEHQDTGALGSLERRQGERRHAMLPGRPGERPARHAPPDVPARRPDAAGPDGRARAARASSGGTWSALGRPPGAAPT